MIIELKNVSVLRNSEYILKDINWSIKKGENWAMLGLNGAGKTTIMDLLNGYIFPSKGTLNVLGKTVGKYDMRELRKSIGWVSTAIQEKFYGYESAEDIVLSGKFASVRLFDEPTDEDREFASYLLDKLSILSLAKRHYGTLSQGEKQRVLIARAMMPRPSLLILDEPCTGLDLIAREQLLDMIGKLSEDKGSPTLIYVTHHTEEILPTFTHTLLLRRGEIHSKGVTKDILTEDNLSDFFEAPIKSEISKDRFLIHLDYERL